MPGMQAVVLVLLIYGPNGLVDERLAVSAHTSNYMCEERANQVDAENKALGKSIDAVCYRYKDWGTAVELWGPF